MKAQNIKVDQNEQHDETFCIAALVVLAFVFGILPALIVGFTHPPFFLT